MRLKKSRNEVSAAAPRQTCACRRDWNSAAKAGRTLTKWGQVVDHCSAQGFGAEAIKRQNANNPVVRGGTEPEPINQVNVHLFVESMPFGGVGYSGIGHYYGKDGFEALTHAKSILVSPPE